MATIVQRSPITNALVDFLYTSNFNASGIMNEFKAHVAPDPLPTELAYGVIYPITGVTFPAPKWDGSNPLSALRYQISYTGFGIEQTEALADRIRAIMDDTQTYPLAVAGQNIVFRDVYGGPTTPMIDPNSPKVSIAERFLIYAAI